MRFEVYECSSAQRRLFMLKQLGGDTTVYNLPRAMIVEGEIDLQRFDQAVQQLVTRHEALRTALEFPDGEIIQKVYDEIEFHVEYVEGECGKSYDEIIHDFIRPFDLTIAPLMRIKLVKVREDVHLLLFDIDHIIADGFSVGIITKELIGLYAGEVLQPLEVQYIDFVMWQNDFLQSAEMKEQEKYWLEVFQGELPLLDLPTDYVRTPSVTFAGSTVLYTLDETLSRSLKEAAGVHQKTIFMFLFAVFNILIAKYAQQDDIIIGTPIVGRQHRELMNTVGIFINTLAMRNHPRENKSFVDFLTEVKEHAQMAYKNQDYQFETLIERLNVERDLSHNPLFDVMFVLQNTDNYAVEVEGLKFIPYHFAPQAVPIELTFEVYERNNLFTLNLQYSTKLYKSMTIERMLQHFIHIISQVVDTPHILIGEIDLLTADEKYQIVEIFNRTAAAFPQDKALHWMFEEQVQKTPEAIAVLLSTAIATDMRTAAERNAAEGNAAEGTAVERNAAVRTTATDIACSAGAGAQVGASARVVTYRELNERANRLAHYLREMGIGRDCIVGIMARRSQEMLVGIYATLKAGGAYLPIDPDYPVERVSYMLNDGNARVLLTQSDLGVPSEYMGEVIFLDEEDCLTERTWNPAHINKPNDLIYLIYTSGSTGKPKGAMVEHCSVVNRLHWMQKMYPLNSEDTILQKTPFTFDVSVWELFWWSLYGARLGLLQAGGEKEPKQILAAIRDYQITVMHFVPSMLSVFLDYIASLADVQGLASLRRVFASGEALELRHVEQFNRLLYEVHETTLHNLYGPTEATVDVSYFDCLPDMVTDKVPIGKPIDNMQLFVLDRNNQLLPVGIHGELGIAGVGLARGYLNRPELTREKFVPHPLDPEGRMYKTGDLVRWLPDGNIEYLGRIDNQVKIRGLRIELGEIEAKLLQHPKVKEAVAIVRESDTGDKYICAYLVTTDGKTSDAKTGKTVDEMGKNEWTEDFPALNVPELRKFLAMSLPDYMIPSYFIKMTCMPLTQNGKLNRQALPEPDCSIATGVEYVAPGDEIEAQLAIIWADILGVSKVGVNDNFFELGGHSLKALILVGRILKELEREITLNMVFQLPTIKQMAEALRGSAQQELVRIEKAVGAEYYPVSSAQKRLYVLHQLELDSTSYNLSTMIAVPTRLEQERLLKAIQALARRHESLRTSFRVVDGQLMQKIDEEVEFNIQFMDCASECSDGGTQQDVDECIRKFIRPFDINSAPLFRVGVIRSAELDILLFDLDHIISDGISQDVLFHEFIALYEGEILPELAIQYKDFAVWQNQLLAKGALQEHEEFWLNQFAEARLGKEIPVLNLPLDFPRPVKQSFRGNRVSVTVERELMGQLTRLARETETTLYMVLLAAYNVLLARYTGQTDIVIGTPVTGRTHFDLEKVIGVFVNTLALRNYPSVDKSFRELLGEVKERTIAAFHYQDYPFEILVDKLHLVRDMSRNPLFDTMFSLTNFYTLAATERSAQYNLYNFERGTTQFDLQLFATEAEERLHCTFEYCTQLFKPETVKRMAGHFIRLLESIVEKADKSLASLEILTSEEQQQLIDTFNQTEMRYDRTKTIGQLFEEQAQRLPENIALVCKGEEVSYRELNNRANYLAKLLREKGVVRESIVGIMMRRSVGMLVSMLAVLKAGGAYLPVDPDYPAERIEYMLQDSGAKVVLTERALVHALDEEDRLNTQDQPGMEEQLDVESQLDIESRLCSDQGSGGVNCAREYLLLDALTDVFSHDDLHASADALSLECNDPTDLIYVIYTSGSTGKPKGTMLEHRSVHNFIEGISRIIDFSPGKTILSLTTISFDIFVLETLLPLVKGVKVVLAGEEEQRDPGAVSAAVIRYGVDMVQLTPSRLQLWLKDAGVQTALRQLKEIMIGGEKMPESLPEELHKLTGAQIYNMYGPTETTVWSAIKELTLASAVTIGRPIANTQMYILDECRQPVPVGVVGEIFIAGDGLARGYFQRPELTAERFLPNPFRPGTKMYRTGDLARWLPDGEIAFMGRIDRQVKIRGYRIETGEIEAALCQHPLIKECVTLMKVTAKGETYLVCYYLAEKELSRGELRDFLGKNLPEYMVPAYYCWLASLPLTPNGKVNYRALPEIEEIRLQLGHSSALPGSELEQRMVAIWEKTLQINGIGVEDNFFELGGNSILLVQMHGLVEEEFPGELTVVDLFAYPSIVRLCAFMEERRAAGRKEPEWGGEEIAGVESKKIGIEGKVAIEDAQNIAIIGMAARLPGANNVAEFWVNLRNGVDSVGVFPEGRKEDALEILRTMGFADAKLEFSDGAYLERVDTFDAQFFGISGKEASLMDPHQRLFLETAWHAIEDAGYGGRKLAGTLTGVYAGYSNDFGLDYRYVVQRSEPEFVNLSVAGNIRSILASRIAYWLDLKGPSMVVDTACSSGLTAMHIACRDLRAGGCEQALVGGVKIRLTGANHRQDGLGIMSPHHRARTFDETADGTGSGEGAIVFLLKPLVRALTDGDQIYAVIKGSAVNQDGSSIGITAPNPLAQSDVLERAWSAAGIEPETITYIEAHGTGTPLGDPVEIDGITRAFAQYTTRKQFCGIGSAKTNLGHLDHAAGLLGLLKAVLALKYRELPPTLHFTQPNRKINFLESPVYPLDQLQAWKVDGGPRRCGVSAFGLSGTNCHVILEEAPGGDGLFAELDDLESADRCESGCSESHENEPAQELSTTLGRWEILTISAKSKRSLWELVRRYHELLVANPVINLADVCYTANTGRGHYTHRLALIARDQCEMLEKLQLALCSQNQLETVSLSQGIYVGEYRMVNEKKVKRGPLDITENERRELSRLAQEEMLHCRKMTAGQEVLKEIARLYVRGADVAWEAMYGQRKYRRLSLPVYPFEPERYWVKKRELPLEAVDGNRVLAVIHPLLERCITESYNQDVYETVFSIEKHWVLREHLVNDKYVVPGTTYLEIARVLGERYYPNSLIEFADVMFIAPLVMVEDEIRNTQIVVRKDGAGMQFVITSKLENGSQWIQHAEGKIRPNTEVVEQGEQLTQTIRPIMNVQLLRERCTEEIPIVHDPAQPIAIVTGPRWDNIQQVYRGNNELLAKLQIPAEFTQDLREYLLHPALLDTAVNIASQAINQGLYLPFSYKKFVLYGDMPEKFYSYMVRRDKNASSQETISFDITLLTENGEVFAQIVDYTVKKVRQGELRTNLASNNGNFYEIGWVVADDGSEMPDMPEGNVLLMHYGTKPGVELAERLAFMGCQVVEAQLGAGYQKLARGKYTMGTEAGDYKRLLAELQELKIGRIILFTGCFAECVKPEIDGKNLASNTQSSLDDLFYLTRALLEEKYRNIEIVLIGEYASAITGEETWLNPVATAVFGLGKVIGQEYAQYRCRALDIDGETAVEEIMVELGRKARPYCVAFRSGLRYVPEFRTLDIKKSPLKEIELKTDGVYLITGGTGGLGLAMSKYLAMQQPINLALVNRSALPPRAEWGKLRETGEGKIARKLQTLMEVEALGAKVHLYTTDVADPAQMQRLISELRSRFGTINGVIHAAGVAGDGFLLQKDKAVFDQVLAPKVWGTVLLDDLTAVDEPDFFVMFSSVTALFGAPGQGDYTAANAFLDGYAQYRQKWGKRTLSINWPAWREVGMAYDYGVNQDGPMFKALTTAQALALFEESWQRQLTGVIIGQLNYDGDDSKLRDMPLRVAPALLAAWEKKRANGTPVPDVEKKKAVDVVLKGGELEEYSPTEKTVARIWGRVLGVAEVDMYASFYELGGDSILATHLAKEMGQEFADLIDVADIFTYPSIYEIANYIDKQQSGKGEADLESTPRGESQKKSADEINDIFERLARGEVSIEEVEQFLK